MIGGETETLMLRSAELMLASLDVGNIESIARTCTAQATADGRQRSG